MRFGLRHSGIGSVCLAGCALIAGLDDDNGKGAPADAGADRRQGDGGLLDGACTPREAPDTTLPMIARVDGDRPVTVDGDGAEWDCVERWLFNGGNRRVDLVSAVASIAMQYDDDALYLFATVTTKTPSGTADARSSPQNDSFHWFLTGPSPGTQYSVQDHHIVVDALDQTGDFAPEAGLRPTSGDIAATASPVTPASAADTQAFHVEIRVKASALGRSSFRAGEKIRMNFQLNDGPPTGGQLLPPHRIWFVDDASCPTQPGCNVNLTSEPDCNPQCTQSVTLK